MSACFPEPAAAAYAEIRLATDSPKQDVTVTGTDDRGASVSVTARVTLQLSEGVHHGIALDITIDAVHDDGRM